MAKIDHTPCFTDDEIIGRICMDSTLIDRMIGEGFKVRARVSYHSDSTQETHCLPVFESDNLEDIVNRYFDYFPREFKSALADVQAVKDNLFREDGLSKSKTMMSSFKIPIGLWKMLETWHPGIFEVENGTFKNKKLVNRFLSYAPKLRTKSPYGQQTVSLA